MPAKKAAKRRKAKGKAKKKAKAPKLPDIIVQVYVPSGGGDEEPGMVRAVKALEDEPEWTFL